MKKDQVFTIKGDDDLEQPAILVVIPNGCHFNAVTWGFLDGRPFFDTPDGVHIEIFNAMPYMIQSPRRGWTIDESGKHRELRKKESVILQ